MLKKKEIKKLNFNPPGLTAAIFIVDSDCHFALVEAVGTVIFGTFALPTGMSLWIEACKKARPIHSSFSSPDDDVSCLC